MNSADVDIYGYITAWSDAPSPLGPMLDLILRALRRAAPALQKHDFPVEQVVMELDGLRDVKDVEIEELNMPTRDKLFFYMGAAQGLLGRPEARRLFTVERS